MSTCDESDCIAAFLRIKRAMSGSSAVLAGTGLIRIDVIYYPETSFTKQNDRLLKSRHYHVESFFFEGEGGDTWQSLVDSIRKRALRLTGYSTLFGLRLPADGPILDENVWNRIRDNVTHLEAVVCMEWR